MTAQHDYAHIAATLVGGTALACKAYPDGSLVVIAANGQKFRFSSHQVREVQASFTHKEKAKPSADLENHVKSSTQAKPAAKEILKTTPQRGRPRKAPAG